jgi:hypothetical protein
VSRRWKKIARVGSDLRRASTSSGRRRRVPRTLSHDEGDFFAYALSPRETQIELRGADIPRLGVVGVAFDKVIGHHIADAAVHRFIEEIAERLRVDVPSA